MKKLKVVIIFIIIALVTTIVVINNQNTEVKKISSEKQLLKIQKGEYGESSELADKLKELATYHLELSSLYSAPRYTVSTGRKSVGTSDIMYEMNSSSAGDILDSASSSIGSSSKSSETTKNYSTTNIQVENVDEADINKTDGDYIYSISNKNVVITDVRNPGEIKIAARINLNNNLIPEDIILYNNKLVVIYEKIEVSGSIRSYQSGKNVVVKTYDISEKESPKEIKSFELEQGYYTSRCIGNKLFVIASGKLETYEDEDDEKKVKRSYKEDGETKEIPLKEIQYLVKSPSSIQTTIITENLDNPGESIKVSAFLMNISNAYVSENNIYLLNQSYKDKLENKGKLLKKLFSMDGIFKFYEYYDDYSGREVYTEIYKFSIESDGKVNYKAKNKVDGQAINQYSLDEKNGHLRIATYQFSKGAKITIYDENMKEIGHSDRVGANEKMYSTRFMGDKAYLVTYQTIDPLFVIDLSDEKKPKVLGELSIPGYSTYLHPYDENHIIGIGMETKETVNKNSSGKVTSTTARVVGMKMALFDVTDVRNPKQISQVVIGNSRTTSAILTNPKALLFSREKELIAIPVNNYNTDFEITNSQDYETIVNTYKSNSKSYISEGYCVYKINLTDGFVNKGIIVHENENANLKSYYGMESKLLRGLYIDDNLYTVSEDKIKVNNIETLNLVSELDIKK